MSIVLFLWITYILTLRSFLLKHYSLVSLKTSFLMNQFDNLIAFPHLITPILKMALDIIVVDNVIWSEHFPKGSRFLCHYGCCCYHSSLFRIMNMSEYILLLIFLVIPFQPLQNNPK